MQYITISREYGSGGHEIGRLTAARLGIKFYDRDILKEAAAAGGYDLSYLEKNAENISFTDNFLESIQPVIAHDHKADLFELQKDIILSFASKGPCIIVGRCADRILEDNNMKCLKVFVYADRIYRAKRLSERLGINEASEISHVMDKTDRERTAFYQRYSGVRRGDCHNYDLMLNSGTLGCKRCVDLICASFESDFK